MAAGWVCASPMTEVTYFEKVTGDFGTAMLLSAAWSL